MVLKMPLCASHSPLISPTPLAMTALAIFRGVTACFAAVAMLTLTSVKKSLAYSTIARKGFMLSGYVNKGCSNGELIDAVLKVHSGMILWPTERTLSFNPG